MIIPVLIYISKEFLATLRDKSMFYNFLMSDTDKVKTTLKNYFHLSD